jgi:hypothetical protein
MTAVASASALFCAASVAVTDDGRASQFVTVACLEISPTQCEAIRFVKTIRFVETILSVGG